MVVCFLPLTRGLDPDGAHPVGDRARLALFSDSTDQVEGNNGNIVVHLRLEICHPKIDAREINCCPHALCNRIKVGFPEGARRRQETW